MARRASLKVRRLKRRQDVDGLIDALRWREWLSDSEGRAFEMGGAERQEVVKALAAIGTPEAHGGVIAALHDPSPAVRLDALRAVGAFESEDGDQAIHGRLDDPDVTVRLQAFDLLRGREGSAEAIAAAAARMPEGTASESHATAVQAAAESDAEAAICGTVAGVVASGDAGARNEGVLRNLVAFAGVERGWRTAIGAVLDARDADEDAADAVVRWAGAAAYEPLERGIGQPLRRRQAARGLGILRNAHALEVLREHAKDGDPHVRYEVVRALGRIKHPSSLGVLVEAAYDGDFKVREAALAALDAFGAVAVAATIVAQIQTHSATLEAGAESLLNGRQLNAGPANAPNGAPAPPEGSRHQEPPGLVPRIQKRMREWRVP